MMADRGAGASEASPMLTPCGFGEGAGGGDTAGGAVNDAAGSGADDGAPGSGSCPPPVLATGAVAETPGSVVIIPVMASRYVPFPSGVLRAIAVSFCYEATMAGK